jgi:hypothetical protein
MIHFTNTRFIIRLALIASTILPATAMAEKYAKIDQAYAASDANFIINYAPVFDFDTDGCLPTGAISRTGLQNPGLKPTGSITGNCRENAFLPTVNTYHRSVRRTVNGINYDAHMYELYFEKDQATIFGGGHRHDVETVIVMFKNSQPTYVAASAHGAYTVKTYTEIQKRNGTHPAIVYHKDGVLTHAFRFAKAGENPENAYGQWLTPTVISWNSAQVPGSLSNAQYRDKLNRFDFGSASFKTKDSNFLSQVNALRDHLPSDYPVF